VRARPPDRQVLQCNFLQQHPALAMNNVLLMPMATGLLSKINSPIIASQGSG
jgi:hypothetical protein